MDYQDFVDYLANWVGDKTLQNRSKLIGVSASTLHYWLTGQKTPSRRAIQCIAPTLGLSTKSLLKVCKR